MVNESTENLQNMLIIQNYFVFLIVKNLLDKEGVESPFTKSQINNETIRN